MHFSGGLKEEGKNTNLGIDWNFNWDRLQPLQSHQRFSDLFSAELAHLVPERNIRISSQLVKETLLSSCVWVKLGAASQETVAESIRWGNVTAGGGGEKDQVSEVGVEN